MTEPITLPTGHSNIFDPPEQLRQLRAERPIARLSFPDGNLGWLVTEYATARAVLGDRRFSSRQELRHMPLRSDIGALTGVPAKPGVFMHMDPPQHTRYRRPLTGQFTVRKMNQLMPRVEQIATELLDAMESAGPPVDLVQAYTWPLPSITICQLLGIPYEYRERFRRDVRITGSQDVPEEERLRANEDLMSFLYDLVVQKRAEPTDDLLSGLIQQASDLDDKEVTGVARVVFFGGHETTASMLGLGTLALLQHPDQLAVFTAADEAGVATAAEELLRYLTILQHGLVRTALEDVELDGVVIKAGECVCVSLPEANRDPKQFAEPNKLDVTRESVGHVAFGHGVHQCLGQQLARIELRVGFAKLFRRFPDLRLAVSPEQIPLRDDMVHYGVHELPVTW